MDSRMKNRKSGGKKERERSEERIHCENVKRTRRKIIEENGTIIQTHTHTECEQKRVISLEMLRG
jgi:hypothetical protein